MPRRARLSIPDIAWHIIQRGNNRSLCFCAEEDSRFCPRYLEEFADKFGCATHACALGSERFQQEVEMVPGWPGNVLIGDARQDNLP